MLRKRTAATALLLIGILGASLEGAMAQTALVGGGLTAQPAVKLGSDLLTNGSFDAVSSGVPTGWRTATGWGADQIVARAGFSYRRASGAGMTSQSLQLKKGLYNFSVWVKTENLGTGLRVEIDFRPGANEWQVAEIASGTADWKLYEVKNITVPEDRGVTVKFYGFGGTNTGTAWFDQATLQQQLPQPVDVYLLHPNYRGMLFDDQPQTMKFDISVKPPVDDFARYKVVGTLKEEATGAVVPGSAEEYPARANFVADMDGAGMQPGRAYLASFSLVDISNGSTVYTYPAYRVSRVAASARQSMNMSFDAKNRILLRGQPRFVLGVYDSGGGYSASEAYWEDKLFSPTGLRRMEGLRINFYLNYWMGEAGADAMKAQMSVLQKRNIMYLQTGNCFAQWPGGMNFAINNSDAYVQDIGAHPGSAGYYTADECKSELIPGVFDQYVRLRRLDPDSITFAALFGHSDLILWRDAADVLSTDPYPLFNAEPAGGYNHKEVADWTRWTREVVKGARPIMTVLQFFQFTSQGRWPTRQEMRNHAYMAIVEGANGLWWWAIGNGSGALASPSGCPTPGSWCQHQIDRFNDLKTVIGEIADLEPVLLADDAPGALAGNSNASVIRTKVKLHGGKGYVFAYNYTNQPVSATLTWNTAPGSIAVNAENRTVSANGNSFTDSFGPYQAHVYVIGNGGTGGSGGGTGGGGTTPPPVTPVTVSFANPAQGATLSGPVTVTMKATGGTAPYQYKLDVDTTNVFTGANNSFTLNTVNVANGQRTLKATVTDSSSPAKTSTASLTVTVSNGASAPPPPTGALQVAVTAPKNLEVVSKTNWTVMWVSGAAAGSKTFKLSVGGQQVASQTTSSTGPVTLAWDSTKVPNGTQQLSASVTDSSGKSGTTTLSINVSNAAGTTPPPPPPPPATLSAAFSAPALNQTVSGTTTVGMSATNAAAGTKTFTLAVDGVVVSTQNVSGTTASYAWNTASVTNGSHSLTLTVRDAGGKTAQATRQVTVSNTTPITGTLKSIFTSPLASSTVKGGVPVNVWVENQKGTSNTFTLLVDGKVVGTTTVSNTHGFFYWVTTGLTNGTHTLTARVKDATGNTGEGSITVTVRN